MSDADPNLDDKGYVRKGTRFVCDTGTHVEVTGDPTPGSIWTIQAYTPTGDGMPALVDITAPAHTVRRWYDERDPEVPCSGT